MSVKDEREKQATKIRACYDCLRANAGEWVSAVTLAGAIHSLAVSTKISQARELAKADGYVILWNHNPDESCYMLRAEPLGRDAADQIGAPWDQDRPFAEPFKLT